LKKIMLATDFSERSDRALRRATLLARQFGFSLSLVHVVDDDQPRRIVDTECDTASALLRELRNTLQKVDGVPCEVRVVLADPFAGIAQAAAEEAPDLLVIGPHRRQVLRDVFVGTTAERTIRSVSCPVLMVNAPPTGHHRHVLQTTDLSDGSRDALQRFAALGIGKPARNTLLHVFDAPALRLGFGQSMPRDEQEHYLGEERKTAWAALSRFRSSLSSGEVALAVRHETTSAAQEILKAAEEEQADLIVLATHRESGLAKLILGSVTEQVLQMAPVDVLAIPPHDRG
jgi:nucleotide-binding universal stress UspA family protein